MTFYAVSNREILDIRIQNVQETWMLSLWISNVICHSLYSDSIGLETVLVIQMWGCLWKKPDWRKNCLDKIILLFMSIVWVKRRISKTKGLNTFKLTGILIWSTDWRRIVGVVLQKSEVLQALEFHLAAVLRVYCSYIDSCKTMSTKGKLHEQPLSGYYEMFHLFIQRNSTIDGPQCNISLPI